MGIGVGKQPDPPVPAAERATLRSQHPLVPDVAQRRLEGAATLVLHQVERHHRLEHRHLDGLAGACA